MEGFYLLLFPAMIVLAIGIRVAAGAWDRSRIRNYIESAGGDVKSIEWNPFGPGWFGEKSDRIYLVRYLDRDGNEHEAHCKTSLWTGVYFTQDSVITGSGDSPMTDGAVLSLAEENRRLREELKRARRKRE